MKDRRIEIDYFGHNFLLDMLIVFFNLLLWVSIGFLIYCLNRWYIWVIGAVCIVACLAYSLYTILTTKKYFYYELKEDVIKVQTEFCSFEVAYKDIYKITPGSSMMDKIRRKKDQTITIYTNLKYYNKFSLYFVKENILDLTNEILERKKLQTGEETEQQENAAE